MNHEPTNNSAAPAGAAAAPDSAIAPDIEGHPFKAVADIAELGEKFAPGPHWNGRTLRLSKSHLVFQSRRMCHSGRTIVLAIHRIDSSPIPLVGTVARCEYAGDGLYLVVLELIPRPPSPALDYWLADIARELARMA